jgi:hypothetical protein
MGLAAGWQTVWGIVPEVDYGDPEVVTRFYEIYEESLAGTFNVITSGAMRPGLYLPEIGARRAKSSRSASGTVKVDVTTKAFGLILKHGLGGSVTPVQQGGTIAYLHTYTLASTEGMSLTLQKQIRDAGGTVIETFTYPGSKITKITFDISTDGTLTASIDFDCREERTDISAATPSFVSGAKSFTFAQADLKFNGSTLTDSVSAASVSLERPMNVDRRGVGNQGLKLPQTENGRPVISGQLTSEFTNTAVYYDRFVADTGVTFVEEFVGDNIASTFDELFRITVPDIRITGETPKAGGPDTIGVSVPFIGVYDGTNNPLKIEYITTDVAA